MRLLMLAMSAPLLGGVLAALCGRRSRWAAALGAVGALLAAGLGAIPIAAVLAGRPVAPWHLAWGLPVGAFSVGLDPLSAFFALPILGLSAISAVYGAGYMSSYPEGRRSSWSWFFYGLLAASMLLVVVAREAVLFLIAWEVMSLASYFLVTLEDEKESVQRAGWTYLVATHLGTACLLLLFMLLGRQTGNLACVGPLSSRTASAIFLLALVGFGTKAGFMPMHVWLPEAHPAAPSHVSALMSGVMIKTGIYGLLRVLTLLGTPPAWWGWALLLVGAISGVLGVAFALAQHDLKRLLAYSSVENVGIVALGLGAGLLGRAYGLPLVCALGFAGALLHVFNHALMKGLLFFGAGSVLHGAGTRDVEHLGGLLKRMPWTGGCFAVGAAAICGLPPLNGFVSEFLIFLAGFLAVVQGHPGWGGALIGSLALIGGLALACFTRAFGVAFLGEPRTAAAARAHECGWPMRLGMAALAAGCLAVGLGGAVVCSWFEAALGQAAGMPWDAFAAVWPEILFPLHYVSAAAAMLACLLLLAAALRRALLDGREVRRALTWDCGYVSPSARMQYTASSFAQPITELLSPFLRSRRKGSGPEGYFPASASYATETPDVFREGFYRPAFEKVFQLAWKARWLQHGRIQLYILYIALTLLALLVWRLGWG